MDKRKFNGNKGHSTKAKGIDKRKNPYKDVIHDAVTPEDLKKVISGTLKDAIDGDVQARKLIFEYCLTKPVQQIEQTNVNIEAKDLTKDDVKFINDSLEDAY